MIINNIINNTIDKIKILLNKGETAPHLIRTFVMYGFIAFSIVATKVLVAKLYGQETLGIFSFFFSLASVAFMITSAGILEALTQTIVREGGALKDVLKKSLFYLTMTTSLLLPPFLLTDFFLPDSFLKVDFLLYILIYTLFYLVYSIFRGYKKFFECTLYSLINRLIFIVFVFVLGILSINFNVVLLSLSGALILATIISMPSLFKLLQKIPTPTKINNKQFIYLAFSLFLTQSGFYFLREMDNIIIPYLTNFTELGAYSAHASITNVIRLIAYVFPVVVLPMAAISRYKVKESFVKIIKILLPFSFLVLISTYILVPWLYGESYIDYILPLALVFSSSLLVIYAYFNSVFVGENKVSKDTIIIVIADFLLTLIINTGLIILFVSELGVIGAPLASSLTLLMKIMLNIYGIKKLRRINKMESPNPVKIPATELEPTFIIHKQQ